MNIKSRLSKVEEALKLLSNQDLHGKVFIIWETNIPGIYSVTEGRKEIHRGIKEEVAAFVKPFEERRAFVIWINVVQDYAK